MELMQWLIESMKCWLIGLLMKWLIEDEMAHRIDETGNRIDEVVTVNNVIFIIK